jgi:hypothetical protein
VSDKLGVISLFGAAPLAALAWRGSPPMRLGALASSASWVGCQPVQARMYGSLGQAGVADQCGHGRERVRAVRLVSRKAAQTITLLTVTGWLDMKISGVERFVERCAG